MTDTRTVPTALLRQALEALEASTSEDLAGDVARRGAIAALRAALAQQEPMCVGCEGKPTPQNSPCAVCGKIAQQEQEPVARVIDDGTLEGSIEWIPYSWRRVPLKPGDLLYAHPPRREPEPPPEPLSAAKIRAEFQDLDRYRIPGDEMTLEDWFEAGVRFAERQHEIV